MKYIYQSKFSRKLFLLTLILVSMIRIQNANAQNPFMPPTAFVPDGEPHVFEYKGEKRLFIYGSRDERITGYCGYGHDVWSAPVTDLSKWINHGEVFNVKQVLDIGYGIINEQHFGAPDCVYNPITKKYYLYTFLGMTYQMDGEQGPEPGSSNYIPGFEDMGPKCVMAESETPAGPFVNPVICDWPPANIAGAFDPSVIVDEQVDGSIRVYAYWGMRKGDRWAEVSQEDMHTIINSKTRKPDRNAWHQILDPNSTEQSTLFEASSIKKIDNNHYVFIYSANELISGLTYCYGSSPKGPWTYGGVIVRNGVDWLGGNNHGSIVKVQDQWYVVYHKATINSKSRQAMIEPIELKIENEKVIIPEVEMTSQGISMEGLDAFKRHNVNIACYRTNQAYIDGAERNPFGLNPIKGINSPSATIGFKYFNFGQAAISNQDDLKLKLNAKILHDVTFNVFVALPENAHLKENWISIAEHDAVDNLGSNDFADYTILLNNINENRELAKIGGLKGKLAVFITFTGKENNLCELVEIEFSKGNKPTPNPLRGIDIKDNDKSKIVAVPAMARVGESVKLSIEPESNFMIQEVKVMDINGNEIKVNQNEQAVYAPRSYNFFMPNSMVKVEVVLKE
ncbi:MAG: hypothetical protein RIA69_09295 [Cyclobacteriaceae bacterium]